MVALRNITAAVILALLVAPWSGESKASNISRPDSLFSQTAAQSLDHNFPSRDVSFLLLDARSGQLLASRWEHLEMPIPLGSLAKPFAALAYGEQHGFHFPEYTCRGTATGCWRPAGHGTLNLTSAIAYSCNSYFRFLTANVDVSAVSETSARFGLEPPDRGASGAELAGMGAKWRTSPVRMAEAYMELVHEHQRPGVREILDGMAESALRGTAAEVDRALQSTTALAKTGTAPCTHERHAAGDGFTIALFPAEDPRILLMVRVHGVPGALAAKTAGQMLRKIED
jgi:cell division protein FtsI/penicillin-binding protein 2